MREAESLARAIAGALVEKRAREVVVMDLRGTAPFLADFFVLATALTPDHARSLSDAVQKALAEHERAPHHIEGYETARWLLVDADEVVVHIMSPEAREFYALEALWGDAEITRYGQNEN